MSSIYHNKLKRLYLMINRLKYKAQSKEELLNYLKENELSAESATFERDKKELRVEFGIELTFDPSSKKYHIDFDQSDNISELLHFLELNQLTQSVRQSMISSSKSLQFVDFENKNQLQGVQFIDRILKAIRECKYLEFHHQKFETEKPLLYKVKPLLLKEYQSRWYIVSAYNNDYRLFGIDRISDLKIIEEVFVADKNTAKDQLANCVGVSFFQDQPEYVKLKFDISQQPYLDRLPLHNSQECTKEEKTHVTYDYNVVINYEFKQQILKYGSHVEVLQPESLRNDIHADLQKSIDQYQ